MKNRLFSFLTVIALLTLIIIRFCSGDASAWISCLNYIGLVIAVCGFLIEFASRHRKNKIANFIKGLLMIAIPIFNLLRKKPLAGRRHFIRKWPPSAFVISRND